MQKRIVIFVLSTMVALMGAVASPDSAGAGVKDSIFKEFDVSPGGFLIVDIDHGSIEIRTAATQTVEVEVRLEVSTYDEDKAEEVFKRFEFSAEKEGNDIVISGEYERPRRGWRLFSRDDSQLRIKIEITVPREFNVDLSTAGGDIAVGFLNGKVLAHTSGGNIHLDDVSGLIKVSTSGGDIEVLSCTGMVDVNTSGGNIEIGRIDGEIAAHTSGGNIIIKETTGAVDASTSGGNIVAYISSQPKEDCRLSTSGGNVELYLADNLKFDIDAVTTGGTISTDLPVRVKGKLATASISAELNGGGPELHLRSSGGNIELRNL